MLLHPDLGGRDQAARWRAAGFGDRDAGADRREWF